MAKTPDTESGGNGTVYKDRPWFPRFWDGIKISGWLRLLARNRFMIVPHRIPMAVIITLLALMNSGLAALQSLVLGRKVARTEIKDHPIFIIGHWRAGTTLLHELMVSDDRHTYPDTFACFCPSHYLISRRLFRPLLAFLMPSRRPMDNMPAGSDRPQEDEFALCNLGVPSPYLSLVFPNRPPQYPEYLDLEEVPADALARWKRTFVWFLKCITLASPRRIVLKSPPHTCRIRVLLELFPQARFIHIVRDPYVVFPSTLHLWKRLSRDQGLQSPKYEGLEESVFETFNHMYEVFERDRELIGPGRLSEVSYEALVADPIGEMRRIYEELELGEFDKLLPALEEYVARQAGYKRNRYEISLETRAEIARRWSSFIHKYGYSPVPSEGRVG